MDIVVSTIQEKSDTPSANEAEDVGLRLEAVEKLKARTRGTIEHISTRIAKMFAELNKNSLDLHASISSVLKEVEALQAEQRRVIEANRPKVEDDLDREFKQYESTGSDEQYYSQEERVERALNSKTEDPKLVEFFRKIAAKTHPDKTDDPELHLLFLAAKECRNNNDMQGIMEIWDYITGATSVLTSKLRKRLEDALRELHMLEHHLEYLRRSHDYTLMGLYDRNRTEVLRMSRMQLENKRQQLEAHRDMLLVVLRKPVPKPFTGGIEYS